MNRTSFEKNASSNWTELEGLLTQLEVRKGAKPANLEKLPTLFRQTCSDLSLADHRVYGTKLTDRLNALVIRGYNAIYKPARPLAEGMMQFFGQTFPQAVRRHARLFWFNMLLFFGGFFAMVISVEYDPIWVESLLGPAQMSQLETNFQERGPGEGGREHFSSDFQMFCFYVYNNIGIDFMTFASGILCTLGSIFFMVFNGVHIGAATGYVHHACDAEAFYSFVAGHSSFELIAAVISGTAGMLLGLAILRPGRRTRRQALVEAGRTSLPLILGAASMTFIAACIEGFWSANSLAPMVKYTVGIMFWIILTLYFLLAGRSGPQSPDASEAH